LLGWDSERHYDSWWDESRRRRTLPFTPLLLLPGTLFSLTRRAPGNRSVA
jgi:hypothetical protein